MFIESMKFAMQRMIFAHRYLSIFCQLKREIGLYTSTCEHSIASATIYKSLNVKTFIYTLLKVFERCEELKSRLATESNEKLRIE